MARIRSLHPTQWTDEDFVALSPLARLLALGIRNECDDQGVFEWKPTTLKMRILPVDNVDVEGLLKELVECSQVVQFEADNRSYGAVRNFRRFQNPKKPNAVHPLPAELQYFVGISRNRSGIAGPSDGNGSAWPPPSARASSEADTTSRRPGSEAVENRPNGKSHPNSEPVRNAPPLRDTLSSEPVENQFGNPPSDGIGKGVGREGKGGVGEGHRAPGRRAAYRPIFDDDLGIRPEVARGFIEHRKAQKHALTERAMALLGKELRKLKKAGVDPNDALDTAIRKGWRGLEADWILKPGTRMVVTGAPDQRSAEDPDELYARRFHEMHARQQRP